MTENTKDSDIRRGHRWRIAAWSSAALMLLLPLFAMQVTDQVVWDVTDFTIFGALLVGVGVTFELAVRRTDSTEYRSAVGVALAAVFLLIWVVGAVGMIGAAGDRADLMYGGVLAVGIIGAIIARFGPHGMARALFAMAVAQALVPGVALIAGMVPAYNSAYKILAMNGFFVVLFVVSAWLFRKAAQVAAFTAEPLQK